MIGKTEAGFSMTGVSSQEHFVPSVYDNRKIAGIWWVSSVALAGEDVMTTPCGWREISLGGKGMITGLSTQHSLWTEILNMAAMTYFARPKLRLRG